MPGKIEQNIERYSKALSNRNVVAFLRVLRQGETDQSAGAYRQLYGGKTFESFVDHPRIRTYETHDEFIKDGKQQYTTAAGAYQIVESTWDTTVRDRIGKTDFSPYSQDLAAVALLDFRGALDDVLAGRLKEAIAKCRDEWVSLPRDKPGDQPSLSLSKALTVYKAYGGALEGQAPSMPIATPHPDLYTAKPPPATLGPPPQPSPAPEPRIQSVPAGELIDIPFSPSPNPTPAPSPAGEPTMVAPVIAALGAPLLKGLFDSVLQAFSPLAKEKVQAEIGRHTDRPEVAEQIASDVIDAVMKATKQPDPIVAVAEVKKDPAAVSQIEDDTMARLERMAPLLDRLHRESMENRKADEDSMNSAAARMADTPYRQTIDMLLTKNIIVLLVAALSITGLVMGILAYSGKGFGELFGVFAMLIGVIAGKFGSRYDHAYGSSQGSANKDFLLQEARKANK